VGADDDDGFESPDETDPVVRELRLEIVRLEARLDQMIAANRERAEEMAALGLQIDRLREEVAELSRDVAASAVRWRRLRKWILVEGLVCGAVGAALAQVAAALWF
jgi:acyl-coenzyme A thioesterase PaaI-like protein